MHRRTYRHTDERRRNYGHTQTNADTQRQTEKTKRSNEVKETVAEAYRLQRQAYADRPIQRLTEANL